MKNPLLVDKSRPNGHWGYERSTLDPKDSEESSSFRSLEEIVNRVYPQPEER